MQQVRSDYNQDSTCNFTEKTALKIFQLHHSDFRSIKNKTLEILGYVNYSQSNAATRWEIFFEKSFKKSTSSRFNDATRSSTGKLLHFCVRHQFNKFLFYYFLDISASNYATRPRWSRHLKIIRTFAPHAPTNKKTNVADSAAV